MAIETYFRQLAALGLLDRDCLPLEALVLSAPIATDPEVSRRILAGAREPDEPAVVTLTTLDVLAAMSPEEKAALRNRVLASAVWVKYKATGNVGAEDFAE